MHKFVVGVAAGVLLGVLSMLSLGAVIAAPKKGAFLKAAVIQPQISGGNVSASCNIVPTEIDLLSDGSFVVSLVTTLNGAQRIRHNGIDPTGTSFTLDGVAIASPPAALQALGLHLNAAAPKITAAYSAAAVQTALCGP